jgi:hypothetical protein
VETGHWPSVISEATAFCDVCFGTPAGIECVISAFSLRLVFVRIIFGSTVTNVSKYLRLSPDEEDRGDRKAV